MRHFLLCLLDRRRAGRTNTRESRLLKAPSPYHSTGPRTSSMLLALSSSLRAMSDIVWHALDEHQALVSHRDLSRLLSRCCDLTYVNCPIIRNELINRGRLSSAAARAARRQLVEAMAAPQGKRSLGMNRNDFAYEVAMC